MRFALPPKGTFSPNNAVDPIRFYYHPVVGPIFRARIDTGLALLAGTHASRLLEIGYGSGLLIPTLTRATDEYWGLDLEPAPHTAEQAITRAGQAPSQLRVGDAGAMPFDDGFFDVVIAFSIFEHLKPDELTRALADVARVLRPGGAFIVACPAVHRAMNTAFAMIGFSGIENHHFSSINDVLAASAPWFECRARRTLPSVPLPLGWALYTALRLEKRA